MFSQVSVHSRPMDTGSLLGLVTALSVRILLECFLFSLYVEAKCHVVNQGMRYVNIIK